MFILICLYPISMCFPPAQPDAFPQAFKNSPNPLHQWPHLSPHPLPSRTQSPSILRIWRCPKMFLASHMFSRIPDNSLRFIIVYDLNVFCHFCSVFFKGSYVDFDMPLICLYAFLKKFPPAQPVAVLEAFWKSPSSPHPRPYLIAIHSQK